MLNGIIEKLNNLVDLVTGAWSRTAGGKQKRAADNLCGFLWIVGAILLIIDLFVKSIPMLIVGIVLIVYGIIRCFSPLSFHDSENKAFEAMCAGLVNLLKLIGGFFKRKAKEIKEADKKQMVNGVKEKLDSAKEAKIKKEEARKAEEAEKKAREDALWEARTAAMNAYKAKREGREASVSADAAVTPAAHAPKAESVSVPEPVRQEVHASDAESVKEPEAVRADKPQQVSMTETEPVKAPIPERTDESKVSKEPSVEKKDEPVTPPSEDDEPHVEQRIGDKRYYIFDCPGCQRKVRVPNRGKKGRVAIVCPGCNTRFVKMRW